MSGDLNGDRGRGARAPPPAATKRHPDESPFSEIQHPKKRAFLTAYADTGNKSLAAKLAGIDRSAIYQPGWRDDRKFEDALARAELMACDILEAEAHRRAVEGVEKPVGWYKGRPGGYVREYSDVLLIFLLKGLRPEKYKDRLEKRGLLANLNLELLPDPIIQRLAAGEEPMAVLASWAEALGLPPASKAQGGGDDD